MSAAEPAVPPPSGGDAFMGAALEAAAQADFATSPNPMVGAVLVRDGRIVARGFHARAGQGHAEVAVFADADAAGESVAGADLYVTLEPCSTHGRTPPCVELIIERGVRRVVAAMIDPNPKASGAGVRRLREAGIEVEVGPLEDRARRLNAFYIKHITTGRPYVTAKFAMSLDGRIATHTGASRWITGEQARARVHDLRHRHDAIMVGSNTVIRDDPNLTTRRPQGGRSPLRVVLDSRLRVSPQARIFAAGQGAVLIATSDRARADRVAQFEERGIDVAVLPSRDGRVDIEALLDRLGQRGVISLLAEGGSALHGSLFDAAQVDHVVAFVAPLVIGGHDAPAAVGGAGATVLSDAVRLRSLEVEQLGRDLMLSGDVERP